VGEFLATSTVQLKVRDRSEVSSSTLRKPEMLPPMELRFAAIRFVEAHLGATLEETVNGVSRLLGFRATSAQLRQAIEGAIVRATQDGGLVRQGDLLKVNGKTQ
jgi:hypothetical protein